MSGGQGPALLSKRSAPVRREIVTADGAVVFPHHWQVPAATEKAAAERMLEGQPPEGFDYLGFPWATLIDGLRNDASATWDLLRALETIRRDHPVAGRRATVAQHIHADRFVEFFQAVGITDIFWPHATRSRPEIDGIRVHPFPLFPAQTADLPPRANLHAPRRYLANFIGAYNPRVYLTGVRARIFEDAGTSDDLLIVKREAWHFDRVVYAEQMKGLRAEEARLQMERQHKREYLDAIRESAFTLCPTGSGPNSIRIGEALALGSIPVILSRELALAGEQDLWERACLIEEDSTEGYLAALERMRTMGPDELRERQAATQALYARTSSAAFGRIIQDGMGKRAD